MAKTKKISINSFEKVMNEAFSPFSSTFDWHGIEITVKRTLSLREMIEFVNSVVKSCFTEGTNEYLPEVKEFAKKVLILEKYANFNIPKNVETQYDLVYRTNAVNEVTQRIDPHQIAEINIAIDEKLSHLAQANIEAINKQLTEVYSALDGLQSNMNNIFSGVDAKDLQKLMSALGDTGINNEKIMQLYKDFSK